MRIESNLARQLCSDRDDGWRRHDVCGVADGIARHVGAVFWAADSYARDRRRSRGPCEYDSGAQVWTARRSVRGDYHFDGAQGG